MSDRYFELREARDTNELLCLFSLRYRIYHQTRLSGFSFKNEDGLDLTSYDLHARHMGLFLVEEGISRPVGYQRAVGEIQSPVKDEIIRIMDEHPAGVDWRGTTTEPPLPAMSYFCEKEVLNTLYRECMSRGELMMENTKFCINKPFTTLQLARHMAEAEMAIHFFCFGVRHALACVHVNHAEFYSRFGFTRVPGTAEHQVHGLPMVCITASINTVPPLLVSRLEDMAAVFGQTGRICYNPSNPDRFVVPGESNRALAVAA